MTEQEPKSECHGVTAKKESYVQTKYIGNPLIKRDGIKEIKTKIIKLWTCSKCHKPCKVKEERE